MLRSLSVLSAVLMAAATLVIASPAQADTVGAVEVSSRQLIRYKLSWGRCKESCRIKARVTNISRTTVFSSRFNVSLTVNGRKVGGCTDYLGTIRPGRVKYASCTVRSGRLASMWYDWESGDLSRWYRRAKATVYYRYYR